MPKNTKCSINAKVAKENARLSYLGHLSGTFAILLVGLPIAVVVFVGEKIIGNKI